MARRTFEVEDYEQLKRHCSYYEKRDRRDGVWKEDLQFPFKADVDHEVRDLVWFLGQREWGLTRAAEFAWWNMVRGSKLYTLFTFLDYVECEVLLFCTAEYGIEEDLSHFAHFCVEVMGYYDLTSHIVEYILNLLSVKCEYNIKNILADKCKRKDGTGRFSKPKLQRFIQSRMRLQRFKRQEMEKGSCAYCCKEMPYTRIKGSQHLHNCVQTMCCCVLVHRACYWKEVYEREFCRWCATCLEKETSKHVRTFPMGDESWVKSWREREFSPALWHRLPPWRY